MVGAGIIHGDPAWQKETTCAVTEIKQTLYTHTQTCASTHQNNTKACGAGLVNLLIGRVFWQANLKNRPLSAQQRFHIFTGRAYKMHFSWPIRHIYSCLPHQVTGLDTLQTQTSSAKKQMGAIGYQTVIEATFQPVCLALSDWISAFDSFQILVHIPNVAFQFVQISGNALLTIMQLSVALLGHTHVQR